MSEETPDGIRGDFVEKFPIFGHRSIKIQERKAAIPVAVLLWGPGQRTSHYAKRITIRDHLTGIPGTIEVAMSEDIWQDDPAYTDDSHLYQAEADHVEMADIVFVLIVTELDDRGREITGSQAEVAIFGEDPEFQRKAYIIVPEREPHSFLSFGWRDMPSNRKFSYTPEQYSECSHIRSYCASIIERHRGTVYHRKRLISNLQAEMPEDY